MAILRNDTTVRSADGQTTSSIITAANIGNYGISTTSTYYIGTTQNVFNRASGAQTLTGVSIDGNAATVTNGVYTTGAQTIAGTKTFSDGVIVNGATYYTFNKPTTTNYQTVALFGSASGGLFLTTDSAIIGVGAYYNAGWIATATSGRHIDFAGGTFNFNVFSGATVGGAANWGSVATLNSSGTFSATGDFRAPIFYDSNDTTYYLDPANSGTSLLVAGKVGIGNVSPSAKLHVSGASYTTASAANNNVRFEGGGGNGLGFGTIDATSTYASWIQSGYVPNFATATYALLLNPLGGNVGIGTTSPTQLLDVRGNIKLGGDNSGNYIYYVTDIERTIVRTTRSDVTQEGLLRSDGWGNFTFSNNIGVGLSLGTGYGVGSVGTGIVYANGSVRAPLFYDSNNTAYYIDPASTTALYDLTLIGTKHTYLYINPGNGYEAMVRYNGGSGSGWYVGKRVTSQLVGTESFHFYSIAASATVGGIDTSGNTFSTGSFRAPIFYDSDNTTYYLDPNASTSGNLFGVLKQNDGKFVRDSYFRTISGVGDYYASGASGWYTVASITLTTNCTGGVLYGTLYDNRYDGADTYQIAIVARAECDFTTNNESHYVNVGCTILGSTGITNYQSKIRVLLVASSANSRTYEVQFFETSWNRDTWQLETGGSPVWTIYSTAQAPGTSTGTARVFYISNKNADNIRANTASYSPIYYDSNDTSYYLDAAGTSRLNTTRIGNINVGSGTYLNTITPIGDTNINLSAPSGAFYFDTFPRMPGFYDSANTAYYIDPASTSIVNSFKVYDALYFGDYTTYLSQATPYLRITTANGYGNFGSANSSWFHMTTDRPNFYMAVGLHINGDLFIYNTQSQLTSTSVRAPIFYDSGDTTYYLDPANSGTSMLVAGKVGIGTTSPGYALTVNGTIAYTPSVGNPVFIGNDATYGTSGTGRYVALGFGGLANSANKIFAHNMGEDGLYICSATSRSIFFRAGGGATDHVVITSGGNLGVATTSADTNLQVVGHVHVGNQTTFDNTGGWNKTIYLDGLVHARMRILGSAYASGKNSATETYIWVDNSVAPYSGLITNAGSFTINAGFTTLTNSARSPIFYDSDDTNYYVDPNSVSRLSSLRIYSAFDTASSDVYANMRVIKNSATTDGMYIGYGNSGSTSALTRIFGGGATTGELSKYSTYTLEPGSFRSPIFYDSDNTTYYLDPNNTGYSLLVAGSIGAGLTTPLHKIQATGLISASDATYNNDSTFIGAILNNDGTNPGLDLRRWNGGAAGTNNHGATYIATNNLGDTLFYNGLVAANTKASSLKMMISVSGNVGINTTDFSYTSSDNSRLVGSNTNNKLFVNGSIQLLNNNDAIVIGRGTATFLSDEELGFGWGGGWYMTDGTYLRVRNDKILYSAGEIWGSIFKDSNDTNYYLNPASSSVLNTLSMAGTITGALDATVSFTGGVCTAASYNYILNGANDTGNKLVIFVNGSTRTADGGVNALTIRNDGGAFVLGSASYLTSILGSSVTINGNTALTSASTLTAGNLSGTIPSAVLGNSTLYVGTTAIALNRASASQSLTGVNIDGNAGGSSTFVASLGSGLNYDIDRTTKKSGLSHYSGYSTGTNRPTTYDYTLQVTDGNKGWEISMDWIATTGPAIYTRSLRDCCQNWSSWVRILDSANYSYAANMNQNVRTTDNVTFANITGAIFYDAADSTYYLDPANTTLSLKTRSSIVINNASAPNNLAMLNIGYSGSGETRAIDIQGGWSGGENKSITFTHASSSTNIVAQINAQHNSPGSRLRWGKLYHSGDSSTYTMELISESTTSAYLTVAGSVRAPIFYDSNNTAYYVDPASTGYSAYFAGAIQATKIGIEDGGIDCYMEITDANPVIYGVTYGGEFIFYGDKSTPASFLYYGGATVTYTLQANSSLRAPIFYDSNDTNYYVDPNGNSVLNGLYVNAYYNLANNYKDIYVYGDVNTYYVVLIQGEYLYSYGRYSVTRGYNWTGPDTWNTATHKGGLTLDWEWSGDTAWGGNDKAIRIIEFNESYSSMVAGLGYPVNGGVIIWLRGGGVNGAQYRIRTPIGTNSTVTVYDGITATNHSSSTTFTAADSTVFSTRANTNNVSAEISARYPVRGAALLYNENNAVLDQGGTSQIKSGILSSAASLRAPVFYDTDNTGYYSDPAGLNRFNALNIGNQGALTGNTTYALGAYHDSRYMVGLRYSSGGANYPWLVHDSWNGSAFIIHFNGVGDKFNFSESGIGQASGDFRAPIFYDSNNTAYYIDGASGSKLKYLQIDGDWGASPFGSGSETFTIRSTYASMCQRQTNGNLGYWLHHIPTDGSYMLYGGRGATDGSSWDWSYRAFPNQDGSYVEFRTNIRAQVFYDRDNTSYYVDAASTSNLNALTVAGGNATIYRDLIVNGGASGNFGNRIIVQGTATTYTLQDATFRPTVYLNGDYPVVTLNCSATTNANHGPTLQFAFNGLTTGGSTSRQIVIGANGTGSWLDFGFSGGANGDNTSYNPHNGIAGYSGVTPMRLFSNGLLLGSTGAYPNNITSTSYALDVRGTGYSNTDFRAPIFYDSNNTAYYIDPASTSNIVGLTTGSMTTTTGGTSIFIGNQNVTTANALRINWHSDADLNYYIGKKAGSWTQPLDINFYTGIRLYSHSLYDYGISFWNSNGTTLMMSVGESDNNVRVKYNIYAQTLYDLNNTSYYIDPASTSNLNAITAAGNVTAAQYYTGGWFRNSGSGNGLYNEATGEHFYSDAGDMWNVASANGTQGIRLRTGGHNGTIRGYFYGNDSNDIGLLNNGGNWRVRVVGGDYVLFDGSSARAQVFYDSNDTTYYTDPAGTSYLNYSIFNGLSSSDYTRQFAPSGGYFYEGGSVTGAIKIRLPANSKNLYPMLSFTCHIYNYGTGTSRTFKIGGHFSSSSWYNPFAYCLSESGSNLNVRWGYEGNYLVVWIGETSSGWSYPCVFITDFQNGYSAINNSWMVGWNVSRVTAFDTVTNGPTAAGFFWNQNNDGSGSGLDADLVDGLEVHTARNDNANKIVRTDSNGYIQAGWINTTSGDNGTNALDRIYASSDAYIRYYTPANFRTVLDVPTRGGSGASGTWGISITGSSASCTGNSATATTASSCSGNSATATTATSSGSINSDTGNVGGNRLQYWQLAEGTASLNPTTDWYNAIRMGHGDPVTYYSNTLAVKMTGSNLGDIYTRTTTNGTAGTWNRFWNNNNDGAGSGLDADLLDGYNSATGNTGNTIVLRDASGNFSAGTITASLSGNAATVTNGVYTNVNNTLTGVNYFTSNLGTTSGSLSNPPLQAYASGTNAAFMSFHRGGSYAVNMGLDSDNVLRIGGWSASANRLQLDMSGNLNVAGVSDALQFRDSSNTAYYVDPASTSNINGLTAESNITVNGISIGRGANNVANNTVIGKSALNANTIGQKNSAFGSYSMYANTNASHNSAFGYKALYANTTASYNAAFGYASLTNTFGKYNTGFGAQTLKSNTFGEYNVAVGTSALLNNTTGIYNTGIGFAALISNTVGRYNVTVGVHGLHSNTIGEKNVAIGLNSLYYNVNGNDNVALGYQALLNNTTNENVAVGTNALGSTITGRRNTAIGVSAGTSYPIGGSNNSLFGYGSQASSANVNNEITLGNSSVAALRCQVTSITSLSDFRDKADINNIQVGLSFIEKLRPVTFKWDKREWYTNGNRDGSKKDNIIQVGFIAQELKTLQEETGTDYLKLVYESNPNKLEATPANLLIPLIKAVQELNEKVKTLENRVRILENK